MTHRVKIKRREKKKYPKIGNRTVHSDFEYNTFKAIKNLLPKGAEVEYEPDTFEYTVVKNYTPDLKITFGDGRVLYIETKGYFKYDDRVKMESVIKQHPDCDFRMLFQKDQPSSMGKGSKSRPSDWCKQRAIKYAVGEVLEEWLKETETDNNDNS